MAARLIRENIWRPPREDDDWRIFVIVGRENSGKSLTCASILKACDPTFDVGATHFNAIPFLEDIKREDVPKGKAMMGDEIGVALGSRTWHDRHQIETNQYMQTARDYCRIIGLTIPRLEDLDSQFEGRIHVLLEAIRKKPGEWVEVKWKNVDPSRSGEGKLYKKYPRFWENGRKRKVKTVRIGPPPSEYVNPYQKKKREFQNDLAERVIDRHREAKDDGPGGIDYNAVKEEIEESGLENYAVKPPRHDPKFDDDLIRADFGLSQNDSRVVRKLLERDHDPSRYVDA